MTEHFYHICYDCKNEQSNQLKEKSPGYESLRDPTGLARAGCSKGRDNSFPHNIEQCDLFSRTEESIQREIEVKGW